MNAPGPCLWCGRVEAPSSPPPATVAPDWVLFVPRQPPSLNERLHNAGQGGWAYRKERDEWVLALITAVGKLRPDRDPCKPSGRRRVVFTRMFCRNERIRDYGNLVGGMKVVVDAMLPSRTYERPDKKGRNRTKMVPGARLLVDDTPALLDDVYLQVKTKDVSGLRIEITDLVSLGGATVSDQEEVATP